jgi:hypothetical protein
LSYGWDCDGDTDVDYSGGRRANRDGGLGLNHFDRSGTCGTTADPGRVNWSVEVPNGECTINVDFGESVVRTDLGNSEVHCEVQGEMVCDEGTLGYSSTDPDHCVVTNDIVTVTDGMITVTGYSHDTGRCHSISMVQVSCSGGGGGGGASGPATTNVVGTSGNGDTVQLSYTLDADKTNVYAMAGTADAPMTFPAAFQVAAPFGTDLGGVSPALIAVSADAAFDSWLTVGVTDGSAGTAISASPGLGLDGWTATADFTTTNGAVFWMNPADGPSGTVVLAQLTGASGTATATLQGRSSAGADWQEVVSWSL